MNFTDGERCDVYDECPVTARLAHKCSACGEKIQPGQTYYRIGIVHDRTAWRVKRCARCQAIHEHLRDRADQDEWPDEELACGDTYEEVFGSAPPPEIAALAFALPGDGAREVLRGGGK